MTELTSIKTRYAVYLMPLPITDLYKAGASWLGWDAFWGADVPRPSRLLLSEDQITAITRQPKHYGFHGTIKAPFRLESGSDEDDLMSMFDSFMDQQANFDAPSLEIQQINGFYALVPSSEANDISELAAHAVRHFEPVRSPITHADYEKRKPHTLSDRQRILLVEWGYPYVFDEFRFHMTLTNKLETGDPTIEKSLNTHFSPELLAQKQLFGIGLCKEVDDLPFQVLSFKPLAASALKELCHVS